MLDDHMLFSIIIHEFIFYSQTYVMPHDLIFSSTCIWQTSSGILWRNHNFEHLVMFEIIDYGKTRTNQQELWLLSFGEDRFDVFYSKKLENSAKKLTDRQEKMGRRVLRNKIADSRTVFNTRHRFSNCRTVKFACHESQKKCFKSSNTHKPCNIESPSQTQVIWNVATVQRSYGRDHVFLRSANVHQCWLQDNPKIFLLRPLPFTSRVRALNSCDW